MPPKKSGQSEKKASAKEVLDIVEPGSFEDRVEWRAFPIQSEYTVGTLLKLECTLVCPPALVAAFYPKPIFD